MLKTGRRCCWEEIEVGEVFGWDGCFVVAIKTSETNSFWLASDNGDDWNAHEYECDFIGFDNLYKLPKSVQALWKEE